MLASEETRARFGLDEQGAQQALGLLRAQAAQNRATQATIRQQEEQQLLNTVLDLAQGTQGQAADPVAACKAVQASGLDPQSKQQVLLALEQGRINTGDEPQRVNALAGAIIRGEERGTDTEMALTRAMAAGQLTQKIRERLLQLNEQIEQVKKYTDKHGVPLMLALGVLSKESDNIDDAIHGEAVGLMQLRPKKFNDLKKRYPYVSMYRRENVEQNIELGVLALKDGLEHFDGDWAKAMAEYNIGEGDFKTLGNELAAPALHGARPKAETAAELQGLQEKAAAINRYVSFVTHYCTERQPGFVLPKSSVWAHLPPEKKKKILDDGKKSVTNRQ